MRKGIKTILLLFAIGLQIILPAASNAEEKQLTIGLIPEMNIFKQKQRHEHLGRYLSKKTGLNIKFTILSRYGNIIERFEKDRMDAAFFGSFTGAAAIHKLGVVPIARPVNPDNTSTYQGYIFVRNESGIREIKEMKGKVMAFVEKATTAGYIFPLAYLRENGIASPDGFFREYFYAGSHDAAIDAVLKKKADIGAAKNTIYDRMSTENPEQMKQLQIIARSAPVPSNGLCVRKNLDAAIRARLKEALLSMHNDSEGLDVLKKFGAVKFIETSANDYAPVQELAAKAGIDIKKYNWRNE